MARSDCEICRGSRTIRLPIYRKVAAFNPNEVMPSTIDKPWREYPCPECTDQITQDRVAVIDIHSEVSAHIDQPDFMGHAQRGAAHRLVDYLLEHNHIAFERGPTRADELTFPLVATVGIVSKNQVATLEERVASRQDQVARCVAETAKTQIDNWGSEYGHVGLLKVQAKDQIDSALNSVISSWSKIRALRKQRD